MTADRAALFADPGDGDSGPAGYQESTWAFLTRRGGAAWDRVRELIQEWVDDFPSAGRSELRARLASGAATDFRSAFFELYCHQLLRRSGFEVEQHPVLAHTSRRPDFWAVGPEQRFYLEATITAPPVSDDAAQARVDDLLDGINGSLSIGDFMLGVDIAEIGSATAPRRRVVEKLRAWLATLQVDELIAGRIDELPSWEWCRDGWAVTFEAWPLRGGPGRIVGSLIREPAALIDDVTPIRTRIEDKATRYGKLDAGLLVAVDVWQSFADDRDVAAALYGEPAVQYAVGGPAPGTAVRAIRRPNGLIWGPGGARRSQLSGVLTTFSLQPWLVATHVPTWWAHPEPQLSIRPLGGPFRRISLDPRYCELRVDQPSITPAQLFGLEEQWPHFDDSSAMSASKA